PTPSVTGAAPGVDEQAAAPSRSAAGPSAPTTEQDVATMALPASAASGREAARGDRPATGGPASPALPADSAPAPAPAAVSATSSPHAVPEESNAEVSLAPVLSKPSPAENPVAASQPPTSTAATAGNAQAIPDDRIAVNVPPPPTVSD